MSYRRAWLLVDELNQPLPRRWLRPIMAAPKAAERPLPKGRRIVALYRGAEAKMRAAAEAEIDAIERGLAPAPEKP